MKKYFNNLFTAIFCCLILLPAVSLAQPYRVDKKGALRSSVTGEEVSFFGVNYTTPFAHAYRQQKRMGVDMKRAIDQDVYHFARLGYNAYRIHVWAYEITDGEGNLLSNDHLDLMDWLIFRLKERGIKIIYTPILFGGNGYPEAGDEMPGFTGRWSRCDMTSVEEAIVASENYMGQFVSHVNPYTGLAAKDDPDVVGIEINNEPCNSTDHDGTVKYVNRLAQSIRGTGCKKPVFYNVSHNFQNTQAFYDSKIDGGTFQWYPSGLVANFTRKGNYLPAVDVYPIPFDNIKRYAERARIVYEFDPADVADPYIYPAMVRSFRTAGMSWITQFAYDPINMASINTEYQTHYLNLAYTPGKAISTKIAAEVAQRVPRGASFGSYPDNNSFDVFRVSYREKLSVMNSPEKFIYSNNTSDRPIDATALREVAGVGSSPVVSYEGTGAYFLDKLVDGVWRLEVMPDAVWVRDPFERASPRKEVATIMWNRWPMSITLADLGGEFDLKGLNAGNGESAGARGGRFEVSPGVYLLTRRGVDGEAWNADTQFGNITLGEFVAPAAHAHTYSVVHSPAPYITAGRPLPIEATIAGSAIPDSVRVVLNRMWPRGAAPLSMKRVGGYDWEVTMPADMVTAGELSYTIVVYVGGKSWVFPSGEEGSPGDWDWYDTSSWRVEAVPADGFLTIYDTDRDFASLEVSVVKGGRSLKTVRTGGSPGEKYTVVATPKLEAGQEMVARLYVKTNVEGRPDKLADSRYLCVKMGEVSGLKSLGIGFVTVDGFTWKKNVSVGTDGVVRIPLSDLQIVPTILRPQPFPSFLPDYFKPGATTVPFASKDIEIFEVSSGSDNTAENVVIGIDSVWME